MNLHLEPGSGGINYCKYKYKVMYQRIQGYSDTSKVIFLTRVIDLLVVEKGSAKRNSNTNTFLQVFFF